MALVAALPRVVLLGFDLMNPGGPGWVSLVAPGAGDPGDDLDLPVFHMGAAVPVAGLTGDRFVFTLGDSFDRFGVTIVIARLFASKDRRPPSDLP
jgi:hypothetical protein